MVLARLPEGTAVHILADVTFESSNSRAGVQVPKTHGLVPGSDQGHPKTAQHSCHVLTVTMKTTASIPGVLTLRGQLPNHSCLVQFAQNDREQDRSRVSGSAREAHGTLLWVTTCM